MLANVTAEATGRMLACQLYRMTDDPGMKDMLSFLIARDTMHQNQWMAAWEDLGGPKALPIPDDFPRDKEMQEVSYVFMDTSKDASVPLHDGPGHPAKATTAVRNSPPGGRTDGRDSTSAQRSQELGGAVVPDTR
jgi:Mn-containing catalase